MMTATVIPWYDIKDGDGDCDDDDGDNTGEWSQVEEQQDDKDDLFIYLFTRCIYAFIRDDGKGAAMRLRRSTRWYQTTKFETYLLQAGRRLFVTCQRHLTYAINVTMTGTTNAFIYLRSILFKYLFIMICVIWKHDDDLFYYW
jgi:hypothetical protein